MNIDITAKRVVDDYLDKAGIVSSIETPDDLALYILRYGHRYPSLLVDAVQRVWNEKIDHYDDVIYVTADKFAQSYLKEFEGIVYDYRKPAGLIDTYLHLLDVAPASTLMFGYYFYIHSSELILVAPLDYYNMVKGAYESYFWDFEPNLTIFDLITYAFFAKALNMGVAILEGSDISLSVVKKFMYRVKSLYTTEEVMDDSKE